MDSPLTVAPFPPVPPSFWVRGALLSCAATGLAMVVCMYTLFYWMFFGFVPVCALLGAWLGRFQFRRSGREHGRQAWTWVTAAILPTSAVVGFVAGMGVDESTMAYPQALFGVLTPGVVVPLAHWMLLRRAPHATVQG